jgi:SAM-dependent methyltransferase
MFDLISCPVRSEFGIVERWSKNQMNNPYLEDFHRFSSTGWERWNARDELVRQYAWAVPDREAIHLITSHTSRIVEIGAGTGYWAKMLADAGCDIVAFDIRPYSNDWVDARWFDVTVGGPAKVKQHQDRALMLCWPPLSTMAVNCLRLYRGTSLIYIGEPSGGITAPPTFFELLDESARQNNGDGHSPRHENSVAWDLVADYEIPRFMGMRDRLFIYTRRAAVSKQYLT